MVKEDVSRVEDFEEERESKLVERQIKWGVSEIERVADMKGVDSFKGSRHASLNASAVLAPPDREIDQTLPDGSTLEATDAAINTTDRQ